MTKDQMRIKIAECCGWVWYQFKANDGSLFNQLIKGSEAWPTSKHFGGISIQRPDDSEHHASSAPNYPSDLNAMAEARKMLKTYDEIREFFKHLETIVSGEQKGPGLYLHPWVEINSTAEQQAIAFLKAKGIYTE